MTAKSPATTPRPLTAGEAIDRILAIRDELASARIDAEAKVVNQYREKEARVFARVSEGDRARVHAALLAFQAPLEEPEPDPEVRAMVEAEDG